MEKNDFTLYKKNGKIYSIGMEFNNLIRNADLPAMIGGGKKNRESHLTALGLPVGLALMDNKIDNSSIHDIHGRNFEGGVIKEDIYSKLLKLAEHRKTTNSKTRKRRQKHKKRRRKTRRN